MRIVIMLTFRGKGSIWVILQKSVHYCFLMCGYQLSSPFISCYDLSGDLLEIENRYGYKKMSFSMQFVVLYQLNKYILIYLLFLSMFWYTLCLHFKKEVIDE